MRLVPVLLALSALAACSKPAAPVAEAPVAFDYRQTTKELMQRVIDPTAVSLWNRSGEILGEEGSVSKLPTEDKVWTLAENEAAMLIEGGNLLLLPDRIQRLQPGDQGWSKATVRMIAAASALKAATIKRDGEEILRTGGELYDACTACHETYYIPFQDNPSKAAPGAGAPSPNAPRPGAPR